MDFLKAHRKRLSLLFVVSICLILIPLLMNSCSTSSYDNPKTQAAAASVLITPETLYGWTTNGYGTDTYGYNKMVILDVAGATGATSYTGSGHVPGAYLLDTGTDLTATRTDGVSDVISQVATRTMMDDLIKRTGIDENTVVVITGDSLLNMGMAYFNFRYWGFPRERMKVMYGTNAAYTAAGYTLEQAVPAAPTPSTYNVCSLTQNTSLRAPLSDMIAVAEGTAPDAAVWDVRAPEEYNGFGGSTTGTASGTVVAFEGHVKGAKNLNYTALLSTDSSTVLDTDYVKTSLSTIGVTSDKRTHVY